MVRNLLLLSALGLSVVHAHDLSFHVEFSKSAPFRGESLIANFILRSPTQNLLEAEVAKFPEFRNFWSENTSLRQGPVSITEVVKLDGTLRREVMLGSYAITPMMDGETPTFEPMKIAVRLPSGEEVSLLSEGTLPAFQPLPPAPKDLRVPFNGAVGRLSLRAERNEIPFRVDEPAEARFLLSGDGNFSDISELNLHAGEDIEILSRRHYQQVNQPSGVKVFTYTLRAKQKTPSPLSADLVTFDPVTKRYQRLNAGPIRFTELPPLPVPEVSLPSTLEEADENWMGDSFRRVVESPLYLLVMIGLALSAVGLIGRRKWKAYRAKEKETWAYEHHETVQLGCQYHLQGESTRALITGRELAVQVLKRRLNRPHSGLTAAELLAEANLKLSPAEFQLIRKLINHADLTYSPHPPVPPRDLVEILRSLPR